MHVVNYQVSLSDHRIVFDIMMNGQPKLFNFVHATMNGWHTVAILLSLLKGPTTTISYQRDLESYKNLGFLP